MRINIAASDYLVNARHYTISLNGACNGSITPTVTGGTAPYTYNWEPYGQTTANLTNICAGDYNLNVTDANGCATPAQQNMTEPDRDDWQMTGNVNTNPATQFLGTTDNKDLVFKTNSVTRFNLKGNGDVVFPAMAGTGNRLLMVDANGKLGPGGGIGVLLTPWLVGGNSFTGTNDAEFGSLTANDVIFKVNNVDALRLKSNGTHRINLAEFTGQSQGGLLSVETNGDVTKLDFQTGGNDFLKSDGTWGALPTSNNLWTSNGTNIYNSNGGNVGIGDINPFHKLSISDGMIGINQGGKVLRLAAQNGNPWCGEMGSSEGQILFWYTNPVGYNNIVSGNHIIRTQSGAEECVIATGSGYFRMQAERSFVVFLDKNNVHSDETFSIVQNDDCFCGNDNTLFKVNTAGTASARAMKVTLGNFPDYVFKRNYDLMDIETLSEYIEKHGRLPKMPSAAEVERDGLDLGGISKLLVEKVEELTLYVIDLKKENDGLRKDVDELKNAKKEKRKR